MGTRPIMRAMELSRYWLGAKATMLLTAIVVLFTIRNRWSAVAVTVTLLLKREEEINQDLFLVATNDDLTRLASRCEWIVDTIVSSGYDSEPILK